MPSTRLEAEHGLEPGWIEARTGIRERRWADAETATSDLAVAAARSALADAGADASQPDLLIVATSTPDWPQPATAAAVHGGLGMRHNAGCFDLNAVCSGFVHALHSGLAMLAANEAWSSVLVVGADVYSRILDPADRATSVLFGDGAGAVLLQRPPAGLGAACPGFRFESGTQFAGHEALIVPGGGSRSPLTAASLKAGEDRFQMIGREVRDYGVPAFVAGVRAVAGEGSPGFVVPHQSNLRMLEAAMADLGLAGEDWHTTLPWTGNTAAASIPIALDDARRSGLVPAAGSLVFVGYGGGLSWAALALD